MYVIIVGAGQVGTSIANDLSGSHDVVVVDRDPAVVENLTYDADVLLVCGDGTDIDVLREAGVDNADILIASTDDDETNIVACGAAKTASDVFTIARVKRRTLLTTWQGAERAFNVDFMVSSDLLTAEAIFRISGVAGAWNVDSFAGGRIRMAEFELAEESTVAGLRVREADRWPALTFAAVFHDDVLVPRGDTVLEGGDRVVVIGSPQAVTEFAADATIQETNTTENVVIIGGTTVGFQTAQMFEQHGVTPTLIEQSPDRARELAEVLPRTTVLQNDATDIDFLKREYVDRADVVVAALDSDEQNLLMSLLADRLGVERSVSVVENQKYVDLFETVGVDAAVNPRQETAEEIIRFARDRRTEKIAMLEHDRAEVLEVELDEDSVLVGRPLAEVMADLPGSVVVGATTRAGELIAPRGDTVHQVGDHVVIFVEASVVEEIVTLL